MGWMKKMAKKGYLGAKAQAAAESGRGIYADADDDAKRDEDNKSSQEAERARRKKKLEQGY